MKIGIFLGYGPQTILNKEGLGRYIAGLIKGFQDEGHTIEIVCGKWLMKNLDLLLRDFNVQTEKIHYAKSRFPTPPLWHAYQLSLRRTQPVRQGLQKLFSKIIPLLTWMANRLAQANNIPVFLLWILLYVVTGIFLAPFLLIILVLSSFRKIKHSNFILRCHGKIEAFQKRFLPNLFSSMFRNMGKQTVKNLVEISKNRKDLDVWFVPSLFWSEVTKLKNAPVVITAPDLVSEHFPIGFSDLPTASDGLEICRETLRFGKYFIVYCPYLQKTMLLDEYRKEAPYTKVILHPNNDMNRYIAVDLSLQKRLNTPKDFSKAYARTFLLSSLQGMDVAFFDVRYIFYASQVRANKNIMSLVKSYEYLVRKRFCNIKLVLTCSPNQNEELSNYIQTHSLGQDILFCYNVPTEKLAALYACAELVVNPTLYEGGFPFTFCEGMSVNTPSIMSDIPQVREVLEPYGLEEIMFDPYDWMALANKIEWALENKEKLYEMERPMYEEMAKRTPAVVAKEYIQAFEKFIEMDKTKKETQ